MTAVPSERRGRDRVVSRKSDSRKARGRLHPACPVFGFPGRPNGSETAKNVMGMQHPPTTCFEMARTPKKAAHACLFCFTTVTRGTRLPQVNSFGCSRLSLALGGRRNRAVFEGDGDPYEESGFVSNGAGNGVGFGSRCGYAGEGRQGSAAAGIRSLGFRLRWRHHQRLHLPRHHPVQPQAVGERLLRAALQRHQGLPALCRRGWREHLVPEPCSG